MEILNHNFVIKSCQENGVFSGYASVFDVTDYHNDVVVRGAFCKSLGEWGRSKSMPKMLWQHDSKIPIGVWQEIKEDSYGLKVKGQLY